MSDPKMEFPTRPPARPTDPPADDPAPQIIDGSVLVADDDASIREVLRSLLVNAGYLVFVASNGTEALSFCKHLVTSAALLDLLMPNGNGLVTCEQIRKLRGWKDVPVVMLTGACTDEIVRAALRVGVTGFIAKPFVPDDLLQRVATLTGRTAPPTRKRSDTLVWRRELDLEQFANGSRANGAPWQAGLSEPASGEQVRHSDARTILRAMHSGKVP